MIQRYQFEAKNSRGEVVRGTLEAESEAAVYQKLTSQGFFPLSIQADTKKSAPQKAPSLFKAKRFEWKTGKKVSARDLANIFDHLSLLLVSGFPLLKSLQLVKKQVRHPTLTAALDHMAADIQSGIKLSEAVANFPNIFPPTVSGAVQAGEASGKLDVVFAELSKSFEAEAELRAKITQALAYPLFVMLFGVVTVILIMTFIIPKLMVFFETWEHPLPLPTRILLSLSQLFTNGLGFAALGVLIAAILAWNRMGRQAKQALVASIVKKVPTFNSLFFLADFVPLARTWSLLLKSGVSLIDSIKITEQVVMDPALRASLKQVAMQVSQGSTLSSSIDETRMFPELVTSFLTVGEESGNLDKIFERIAVFYERELDRKLRLGTTLLEPVLILVIGLGIGFIVLSLLLPIFEINLLAQ